MKIWNWSLSLLAGAVCLSASAETEFVRGGNGSWQMKVDGAPYYVKGVTWSHTPVGHKYDYNLWKESEEKIRGVLERDMTLIKAAGGNTLRGLPPAEWAKYLHEKYGVRFFLNDSYGRYGLTVDGVWKAQANYEDPRVRKILIDHWKNLAEKSKDVPGLIGYLIGNENNYGLEWKSAEIENLPVGERQAAKAKFLYTLFNEIALEIKKIDPVHPVGIVNGDVQYLELIAKECPAIDFFGVNVYRGYDYTNLFDVIRQKLDKPVLVSETGCDAYDAVQNRENQAAQAEYVYRNWADLYRNSALNGGAGNCIGALEFEFADEWWKHGQSVNLRTHDTVASWRNGAFQYDIAAGNNMNEEWFGLCSIREEEINGVHLVTPRASYFALKDLWSHDPYTMGAEKVKALKFESSAYLREAQAAEARTAELLKTAKLPGVQRAVKLPLPAVVYEEGDAREIWYPSGYMGDTGAIAMKPDYPENPHRGKTCMQIRYQKANGWGGVFWQDPANDWGDSAGGYDLTGAKKLTFWARGAQGGEKVKFGFGGIGKNKKYHDTAKQEISVTLEKEWKPYSIDLKGKDLSRIKSGFLWVVRGQGAPVEFYLDDVMYSK